MALPQGFDAEAATDAYLRAHAAECRVLDCVPDHSAWVLLVIPFGIMAALLLFTVTGLSRRSSGLAARLTRRRWLQDVLFAIPLTLAVGTGYLTARFWLEWVMGVSRGMKIVLLDRDGKPLTPEWSPVDWLGHRLMEWTWLMILAAILLPIALAAIRRLPRTYWTIPAALAGLWLFVAMVDMPYARVQPLPAGPLTSDLHAMVRASGQQIDRLVVGEPRSSLFDLMNAHVGWWEGAPHAVLSNGFYNILPVPPESRSAYRPVTAAEVRAVAGHELAHLRLRHAYIGPALMLGLLALLAWAASAATRRVLDRFGPRLRLQGLQDAAAFPMVALMFFAAYCLFFPLRNVIELAAETQADAAGLDISRDPDGDAALAMRWARGRPIRLPLVEHLLFYDHPSAEQRIRRAMNWKARNVPTRWQAEGLSGPVRVRGPMGPVPVERYLQEMNRSSGKKD